MLWLRRCSQGCCIPVADCAGSGACHTCAHPTIVCTHMPVPAGSCGPGGPAALTHRPAGPENGAQESQPAPQRPGSPSPPWYAGSHPHWRLLSLLSWAVRPGWLLGRCPRASFPLAACAPLPGLPSPLAAGGVPAASSAAAPPCSAASSGELGRRGIRGAGRPEGRGVEGIRGHRCRGEWERAEVWRG